MSNKLKELRARHQMKQEDLAKKAQVSRQTISRIENGENPSFEVALRISEVFDISVNEIFLP